MFFVIISCIIPVLKTYMLDTCEATKKVNNFSSFICAYWRGNILVATP